MTQTDRQSDIRPRFSGPTRDQKTLATRELSGGQEKMVDMSEPTYDDRVLALEEELQIPTSDTQATMDAEAFSTRASRKDLSTSQKMSMTQ